MRRRAFESEDGVAIVVAIGALTVLLALSAMAFTGAMQLNESSNADREGRDAFQSAEAGLEVATYRVNNLLPLAGGGCRENVFHALIG